MVLGVSFGLGDLRGGRSDGFGLVSVTLVTLFFDLVVMGLGDGFGLGDLRGGRPGGLGLVRVSLVTLFFAIGSMLFAFFVVFRYGMQNGVCRIALRSE